jgi:hypothetical protein
LPAAQITLASSADTCIFEASPFNNAGGHFNMAAGATASGPVTRGLLKFDLAGILPASATVTSARLNVTVVRTPFAPQDSIFAVHRILADWGEGNKTGNSGAAATAGEATWEARKSPTTFWSSPGLGAGTDYATTPSSTVFVQGLATYLFPSSAEMVADVQAWLAAPANNFGWLLLSRDEATDSTARRFASREDPFNAPRLTIDYEESAPPLRIEQTRLSGDQFKFEFTARAGKEYVVERRGSVEAGAWTVITNVPMQTAGSTVVICDGLTNRAGFYRVGEK